MVKRLHLDLSDALIVVGGGLLVYGVAQMYAPAGYVAGGLMLAVVGFAIARRA